MSEHVTLWEIVTVLIIPSGGFAFWLCWNEIKALRRKSHLHDSHITAVIIYLTDTPISGIFGAKETPHDAG